MDIPKHAKKVFNGIVSDVYQWEQKLFDGTTMVYEGLKKRNSVQILPIIDGKIIISQEEQSGYEPFINVIGGGQEFDESPFETAKRELLEETGMVSDSLELVKTYESRFAAQWNKYLFVAKDCRIVSDQKLDAGERVDLVAVSFDEFMDILCDDRFCWEHIALDFLRMQHNGSLDEFRKLHLGI